jgi:hypothetical protein
MQAFQDERARRRAGHRGEPLSQQNSSKKGAAKGQKNVLAVIE